MIWRLPILLTLLTSESTARVVDLLVAAFRPARRVRKRFGLDVRDRGFSVEVVDGIIHAETFVGDVGDRLVLVVAKDTTSTSTTARSVAVGVEVEVGVVVVPE